MKKLIYIVLLMGVVTGCGDKNKDTISQSENIDVVYENTQSHEEDSIQEETQEITTSDGLRKEFKEAMDTYEQFYEEYIAFMVEYKQNSSDLSLIGKYADMMMKLAEMEKSFAAWEEQALTTEEFQYYLDVQTNINKKLIEASL